MQYVKMKLTTVALCAVLGCAGYSAWADDAPSQGAGQDIKDSAHSAKNAAVKTGRKVSHGVKKGVHKSAQKVGEGADKVKAKTPSE